MVMDTAVWVMGLVIESIVKPVAVPALRVEEKASLTVRVFELLSHAQDKPELRSPSLREQLNPLLLTMSICWLLEASGFILGNTS